MGEADLLNGPNLSKFNLSSLILCHVCIEETGPIKKNHSASFDVLSLFKNRKFIHSKAKFLFLYKLIFFSKGGD